jgi:hypothetical protein
MESLKLGWIIDCIEKAKRERERGRGGWRDGEKKEGGEGERKGERSKEKEKKKEGGRERKKNRKTLLFPISSHESGRLSYSPAKQLRS